MAKCPLAVIHDSPAPQTSKRESLTHWHCSLHIKRPGLLSGAPALKPLGRSFSPLTANTLGRTYDSASVAPKASKKKGRSPSSSLALRSVDARRTPAENVLRPASTTDRRDNCLLLTQDAGFLKGSKRAGALPRLQPLHGPRVGTLILGLLWALWHLPEFLVPAWAE